MGEHLKTPLSGLALEEKASLCSGLDGWRTKPLERAGIGSVFMADGPNGLRRETVDENGRAYTEKATCFPCSCLMAASFNKALMEEMGRAIALEAAEKGVDLLLGPSVNIKRSGLCGRNFEYFSEDPLLSGKLAASFINGLQGSGTGATLKHFALNNQEKARLSSNSIADERAKREIYLRAFEIAIGEATPWAVMSSYNKADGTYTSESLPLLRHILREEWGYDGLVMSDWGSINSRSKGLEAGLDLEMPSSDGFHDSVIVEAVKNGELDESFVDKAAQHVFELSEKVKHAAAGREPVKVDYDRQHALARRFAAEGMVLLKNEDSLLPLDTHTEGFAVIGEFARKPRYQGGGAANVHPARISSFLEELESASISFGFAPGYEPEGRKPDETLIAQAEVLAKEAHAVLIFAGTPVSYESEGYDRPNLKLPEAQNELIRRVAAVNPNTVVVLFAGAALEMPWINDVKSVLMAYLPGQAGAGAVADILFGKISPSGKLPESFPINESDLPCRNFFGGENNIEYRESIFVGYRYFGKDRPVRFPFGHGLSYSSFEYSGLEIKKDSALVSAAVRVKNTGGFPAAEAAQLYVSPPESAVFRPELELRAFEKVFLQPGESRVLEFTLNRRDFAFYNTNISAWQVLPGEYKILLGASSRDIRLEGCVHMENSHPGAELPDLQRDAPEYYHRQRLPEVSRSSFEALLGHSVPEYRARPFTRNSTLKEVCETALGRQINKLVRKAALSGNNSPEQEGQDLTVMLEAQADFVPIHSIVAFTRGAIHYDMLDAAVIFMNKKRLLGISRFIKAYLRAKKESAK